jgi:hypothetical protein
VYHDVSDQTMKLKKRTRMRDAQLHPTFETRGTTTTETHKEHGYIGGTKMRNVTYVGLEMHLSITCIAQIPAATISVSHECIVETCLFSNCL